MKGGSPAALVAALVARRRHLWRRRQRLVVDMLSTGCWSTFARGGMSLILSRADNDEDSTIEGQKDTRRTIFLVEMCAMNGTYEMHRQE